MKIIECDNFNRDYKTETVIAQNISKRQAEIIVETINNIDGENSQNYFKIVEDDYLPSLSSMYDLIDDDIPAQEVLKHLGVSIYDIDRIKEAIERL